MCPEQLKVEPNEGKKTFGVAYVPQVIGPHKASSLHAFSNASLAFSKWITLLSLSQVTVLFAGQQIPKSPFEVNVDKALGDASKVTVKGPGIEPVGNIANKPTYFEICTAGQRSAGYTSDTLPSGGNAYR